MSRIRIHKINEFIPAGIALRKISAGESVHQQINYAHRDDYYVFHLINEGKGKMMIDFTEYEVTGHTAACIVPGQVHFPIGPIDVSGWVLIVDTMYIKDEYRELFDKIPMYGNAVVLNEEEIDNLEYCISMINKRYENTNQHIQTKLTWDLVSCYIGMIAELFQKKFPVFSHKRPALITFQFKSLLSSGYKSIKTPSQYAHMLNLSLVYLNEVVKKTTGLTVSNCISNEICTQAKRLLFYTNMSIKEISSELGYEDPAYFTRLFTKVSSLSPTKFREKYLK